MLQFFVEDKVLVVFDAKFRFDEKSQEYLENASIEDYQEEATRAVDIERIANITDIFKMHTYRDALGASSAVILYPGNMNMFFSKSNNEKTTGDCEQIFRIICNFEEGVAYLALVPR